MAPTSLILGSADALMATFMCGVPGYARTPSGVAAKASTSSLSNGHPRPINSRASVVLPMPDGHAIATAPHGESTALACNASYPRMTLMLDRTLVSSVRCQSKPRTRGAHRSERRL